MTVLPLRRDYGLLMRHLSRLDVIDLKRITLSMVLWAKWVLLLQEVSSIIVIEYILHL